MSRLLFTGGVCLSTCWDITPRGPGRHPPSPGQAGTHPPGTRQAPPGPGRHPPPRTRQAPSPPGPGRHPPPRHPPPPEQGMLSKFSDLLKKTKLTEVPAGCNLTDSKVYYSSDTWANQKQTMEIRQNLKTQNSDCGEGVFWSTILRSAPPPSSSPWK